MAQKIYDGVNDVARNTIRAYGEVSNIARNLIRGYLGDKNGIARQFWGARGYVIFDEGRFYNVPEGFNLVLNYVETNDVLSDLKRYYLTNKLLWVHSTDVVDQWIVDQQGFIDSNYSDYDHQIIKNEIYIPINNITSVSKLRIIAKGTMQFNAYWCSNGTLVGTNVKDGYISSDDLTVKELDISGNHWADYIKITAPTKYDSWNEDVTNPYIYQPIPFVVTNHIYTNDSNAYHLPGYEFNQISGGVLKAFLKYREPDGSNQCLYIMSTQEFTLEFIERWGTPSRTSIVQSTQISSNPPIHALIREGYWWGYKFQNIPYWYTNYWGGWNMYWDIDVGNIVLYGQTSKLEPHGIFEALQKIKRIEITVGEIKEPLIPIMTSNTEPEGICSSGDGMDSNYAYYAFDGNIETYVGAASDNVYGWVQYEFATPVTVSRVLVTARQLSLTGTYTFTLKVSLYREGEWHEYGQFTIDNFGMQPPWKQYTIQGVTYLQDVEKIKVETLNPKIYGESYHIANIQAQ